MSLDSYWNKGPQQHPSSELDSGWSSLARPMLFRRPLSRHRCFSTEIFTNFLPMKLQFYLWERAGQEPVAKQILRREWGWIGRTLRKPASSTTLQALTWNPQRKRKRGRPRNSWRRDTEAELKQQGTNWSGMTRAAQNRVRWRGVVDGLCSTGSDGHK